MNEKPVRSSPLRLERYHFSKIVVESGENREAIPLHPLRCEVIFEEQAPDPEEVVVHLNLLPDNRVPQDCHYKIEVSVVGAFTIDAEWPAEKRRLLLETNAPSLLFGAAREMIANLTARGPWPMVTLPTISFLNPEPSTKSESLPANPPTDNAAPPPQPKKSAARSRPSSKTRKTKAP